MKAIHTCFSVIFTFILIIQGIFTASGIETELKAECIVSNFTEVSAAVKNCEKIILDNIIVPAGKTLNLALRDGARLYFSGITTFEYAEWAGPLVAINATNALIAGEPGSILDGQGQLYWDGKGEWGSLKPKFFIIQLQDSLIRDIYVLNSPVHCVLLADSTNVQLLNWVIDNKQGDEDVAKDGKYGHNTDGFDVWNSTDILLKNATVYNQDDCVALRCGSNIIVDDFYCHGGHGLSISVGFSNDSVALNTLRNVRIINSVLHSGENGIHLKTHVDAGTGLMDEITYENITFKDQVNYGINIQQNYQNLPSNSSFPSEPKNNIPIKHLVFKDIFGQVEDSAVPVYILCADDGCFDWIFSNVLVSGKKNNNCNYEPKDFSC